jgi:FKBP-type peptidyl-prolyl cis-trans isomerase FkpA
MINSRLIRRSVVLLSVLAMSACDDPFQVIEELTFAESLGIVLSEFTRLDSGVYIKDVLVGSGAVTAEGQTAVVEYTGYLANGTSFGNGDFPFVIGSGNTIAGFELGVFGMRTGGQRRIIIPPSLGYADSEQPTIPAGSVLVFDVELCTLDGVGPNPDCAN